MHVSKTAFYQRSFLSSSVDPSRMASFVALFEVSCPRFLLATLFITSAMENDLPFIMIKAVNEVMIILTMQIRISNV